MQAFLAFDEGCAMLCILAPNLCVIVLQAGDNFLKDAKERSGEYSFGHVKNDHLQACAITPDRPFILAGITSRCSFLEPSNPETCALSSSHSFISGESWKKRTMFSCLSCNMEPKTSLHTCTLR